jgi:type VI secretion system protein ImpE
MMAETSSAFPLTGRGNQPLSVRLAQVEAQIRARPAAPAHRWALFQLLCVMGHWERAVQQLQVYAQLDPQQAPVAQACRDLIRAERWRAQVLAGCERPGFVFDAPLWVEGLLEALRLTATGQLDEADLVRERALDRAPLVPVRSAGPGADLQLDWIADSDSRLGPVCEVITAGHYRWLPFSDIAAWRIERPAMLLDLVWAPCTLTLTDGSAVPGFMPARYPGSENFQGDSSECDAIRLGHRTSWEETGRTGVTALGQKTWATSAGDLSIFELAKAEFGDRVTEREPVQQGGAHGQD